MLCLFVEGKQTTNGPLLIKFRTNKTTFETNTIVASSIKKEYVDVEANGFSLLIG